MTVSRCYGSGVSRLVAKQFKPAAMNARAVNVAILLLLALELATGLGSFLVGEADGVWIFCPLRLVAPGHRGYAWVKWISEVEVSRDPAWLEPPLPLR